MSQMKTLAYGKEGTDFYDEFPEDFHPEEIMGGALAKTTVKNDKKAGGQPPVHVVGDKASSESAEKALEEELSEAQRRIRQLEQIGRAHV